MFGEEEIIFSGSYKGFSLGVKYNIKGKDEKEVASVLASISSAIEPHAFVFSEINTKGIQDFVKPDGKGLGAVIKFLENNSSRWTKWIKGSEGKLPDPKLITAAESYLFNILLDKAGVKFKVSGTPATKPEKEEVGEQIVFVGSYGKWVAIKKLSLEKVKDYEVSAILSGINHTIVNKSFELAKQNNGDDIIDSITKGKRKSYGNAVFCLKELESKLNGDENPYLVCKVLEKLGYKPYASPDMLTAAHSDIKPPKVKGRKPKG